VCAAAASDGARGYRTAHQRCDSGTNGGASARIASGVL